MQSPYKYFLYKRLTCNWNSATQESGKLASQISTFLERKYEVKSTLETFPRSRIWRSYILLQTLGDLHFFFMIENHQAGFWFFSSYNCLTREGSNLEYKHSLLFKQDSVSIELFCRRSTKQQNEALEEPEKCSSCHCSLLLPYKIYLSLSMPGLTDL